MRERKLNRLKDYNYSEAGFYFATICAKDGEKWFGKVENNEMILNEYGEMAEKIWCDISNHYPNIQIDAFAIMPNHIHGIIIINKVETGQCPVSTNTMTKSVSLSQIIKSYKNVCTKTFRQKFVNTNFRWQRSFYDHIIRNDKSLEKVREYIEYNRLKWAEDVENNKKMKKLSCRDRTMFYLCNKNDEKNILIMRRNENFERKLNLNFKSERGSF